MSHSLNRIVALATIAAAGLHLLSDLLEWLNSGFTQAQLLVNYAAFLVMPFVFVGLYSVQRSVVRWYGLLGALLYAVSFIYFAHSTLVALESSILDYPELWTRLGGMYTFHGGLMVLGGTIFGLESLRVRILSRTGVMVFLVGISLNLLFSLLPVPEGLQAVGSAFRNLGLILVGAVILNSD